MLDIETRSWLYVSILTPSFCYSHVLLSQILNSRQNLRRELHGYSYTSSSVTQVRLGLVSLYKDRKINFSLEFWIKPSACLP